MGLGRSLPGSSICSSSEIHLSGVQVDPSKVTSTGQGVWRGDLSVVVDEPCPTDSPVWYRRRGRSGVVVTLGVSESVVEDPSPLSRWTLPVWSPFSVRDRSPATSPSNTPTFYVQESGVKEEVVSTSFSFTKVLGADRTPCERIKTNLVSYRG